ncbi:phosphoribosylamine--glycine ligase [Erysipelotrichaceae bacterium OttesenSCG-928-M19]|nr:phosphoribosylamine--glycine ligase [Erysipelotrichaceae bacterium OttesenSCG-928-M19]
MKVLVVGSGGREHAIVDKVQQSKLVDQVYALPGNYGIGLQAELVAIDSNDNDKILAFVKEKAIDLVIIGPENVLFNGLADVLIENDIKVLGPTKAASLIEASKEYAKELMAKYQIPTAQYQAFTDYRQAMNYIKAKNSYPIVIKYDGLAAGKGVYIVNNEAEATYVLEALLVEKTFGDEGLIIEDFLTGDEFTLLALVNNERVYPFQTARDFKRVFDNDEGLNTGGMGAICPYHNIDEATFNEAYEILKKTAAALVKENRPFSGVLYGGFMRTAHGVKVIEYNARFGDPETQCVLNNLASDLVENILDLLSGKEVKLEFKKQTSVGVVLSAPGYPEDYEKGIDLANYLTLPFKILHMQSQLENGTVISAGGRVLFVLNEGKDSKDGFTNIYEELNKITKHSLHYRKDLMNY